MLIGKKYNKVINSLLYGLCAVLVGAILLLLFSSYFTKGVSLDVGEIAQETIFSPRDIEFESEKNKVLNSKTKESLKNKVGHVYSVDPEINQSINKNIQLFFDQIQQHKEYPMPEGFDDVIFDTLKNQPSILLEKLERVTLKINEKITSDGVTQQAINAIESIVEKELIKYKLSNELGPIITEIITYYIKENLVYDPIKTQLLTEKMIESAYLNTSKIKKGHAIIYKSDIATAFHIEVLDELGIRANKVNIFKLFFITLMTLFIFGVIERLLKFVYPKVYSVQNIVLILIIVLIIVIFARCSLLIQLYPEVTLNYLFVPIGIAAILSSFLLNSSIAFYLCTFISIFVAIIFKFNFNAFLFVWFSSFIHSVLMLRSSKRSDLIVSGYIVGLFNVFMVICIGLFQENNQYMFYIINAVFAFANGIISAMISMAILPYFESFFRITTIQSLLELSNLNHPLMKRLLLNAPGTYQHSLMVANLAEAAANEIRANNVLCRVSSYFHDIGKLNRPIFFIENQFSQENPHKKLTPQMSKNIIISHTTDGLELAKKYQLPTILQDIIVQHHGTSCLSVFYHKAVSHSEEIDRDQFRYPGPKPQTKESGIVMLADCVEAATKALEKPSYEELEQLINRLFKEKIDDGQLVDCPLSFNEITKIKQAFLTIYKGIHHHRNDYEKEIKSIVDASEKPEDKDAS